METLSYIFTKHNTDKGPSFHNYTRQYENLLKNYRDKPIKYLEIGVYNGDSLKAFREAFKNSTCILGLDITPLCKQHEDIENNIFVEIGDATDPDFLREITKKYGTFDIILDDGSHKNGDVIKTFEILFPLLNDDGLYIVEDTHIFDMQGYVDENYENHLEYFFKYTKFLSQRRSDLCSDPFKLEKKTTNVFEYSIDKIEYGCSYIGVHKKVRKHWIE